MGFEVLLACLEVSMESVSQTHFELEHRNGQAGLFSLAYRKKQTIRVLS